MSASEQKKWAELCEKLSKLQSEQLSFPVFENRWTTPEKLAKWKAICDAKEVVRRTMEEFIEFH
jgi:hypothetical protein